MAARFPDIWLGESRGHLADWVTQRWVQYTGRSIDLGEEDWLNGPIGNTDKIGESYFKDYLATNGLEESGLVDDFDIRRSDIFHPNTIAPEISDFYENTTHYDLDVWS